MFILSYLACTYLFAPPTANLFVCSFPNSKIMVSSLKVNNTKTLRFTNDDLVETAHTYINHVLSDRGL